MADTAVFAPGSYRYIPSVFQYSSGVAAQSGFAIERARLARPLPLAKGFAAIERHLRGIGRPRTALAACELRSPAPFSEDGFAEFNRHYVRTLDRWGLIQDGANPVARTNVCPRTGAPAAPSLYAFSYTVPARSKRGSFIVSGSGESREGEDSYKGHAVRFGEVSAEAMREKVRFVVAEMARRMQALGFGWEDAASVQAYTVRDIGPLLQSELARKGFVPHGLTWHFCRPPVAGLEFEMDVRGAARELIL